MDEESDERAEELATVQSIYPELAIDPSSPYTATLDLLVAPTKPLPVTFTPENDVQRLGYLPALHVEIQLPAEYPSDGPPHISITTTPPWLPESSAQRLADEANVLWDEYGGGMILFAYISSLQEQAEACFGTDELALPASMRAELLAYSKRLKRELFDKETFDCEVCLEPKKGSACYRMERCSHVFCIACLQNYYNNCITEGAVNNVKCMSTECSKPTAGGKRRERLLSPKELLQIPLPREQVERYVNIKRKKKMESDPNIMFCPRSWCQGAMRSKKYPKINDVSQMDASDSEAEDEDGQAQPEVPLGPEKRLVGVRGMDRLAVCEDCTLAFCVVCLSSWHGDFVRCEPRDATQLTEEDQASLNFIMKNTSPCAYCSVPCQKSFGCKSISTSQMQEPANPSQATT